MNATKSKKLNLDHYVSSVETDPVLLVTRIHFKHPTDNAKDIEFSLSITQAAVLRTELADSISKVFKGIADGINAEIREKQ